MDKDSFLLKVLVTVLADGKVDIEDVIRAISMIVAELGLPRDLPTPLLGHPSRDGGVNADQN